MSLIQNGKLIAPHFVFIRNADRGMTDRDLLEQLSIGDYKSVASPPIMGPHVLVRRETDWLHLAEDWLYTLWHAETTRDALLRMSTSADALQCVVGDSDRSYEFRWFTQGKIAREYVVTDPNGQEGIASIDKGTPLPGEAEALKLDDELDKMMAIARAVGVCTHYEMADLRIYASPDCRHLDSPSEPSNAPKRPWWRFW